MMHDHWANNHGMWGMGWGHLIVALILVLIVVALIKYIFFD
jgi:hypothetical protein